MFNIAFRNLKVFFRDRAAVLYSLMAVFMIIGLYVLFIGNVVTADLEMEGARFLTDSWIMAGMIAAGTFTTTLGALGRIIDDEDQKITKDFRSSPLRRSSVTGGYVFSALLVGMALSILTLVLAEGYILANGGTLLPLGRVLELLAVMLLSVLASGSMMFFAVSFIGSSHAFAGLSTICGVLIGFITGVYMPIGIFPAAVQTVVKAFPISHASALMRQIMMARPLAESFTGAPLGMRGAFEEEMGVRLFVNGTAIAPWIHIGVLVLTALVFGALSVMRVARKKT
ncbi:MAG: ABC transporter permease [Clostridia bacterium]|nr:ABC transporter permease [Clostridia bacterium]